MKEYLHRMKESIANPATPDELYTALVAAKKKVYEWSTRKVGQLRMLAEWLLDATDHLEDRDDATVPLSNWTRRSSVQHGTSPDPSTPMSNTLMLAVNAKQAADSITYELLRFCECRNLNSDTVSLIVQRMYRYSTLGPQGKWLHVEEQHDLFAISIDEIFYCLSMVYDRVKSQEEKRKGNYQGIPSGAVGSQVFDRRSVKYWVHPQDLPFVIARICQHLPLSTVKDVYVPCKEKGLPFRLGAPVSSVYYDNNNFLFYHRRLERLEGSSLIRIRWYTDPLEPDWNTVASDQNVFMEMKVHHEAWSGERSNKRRFALKERDVNKYLRGQLSLDPAVQKLRAKGASDKEVEKFKFLAREILDKVEAYGMKPVLRTQCVRAAFQRGTDQSIRVSIDTELRMSAEDFGLSHNWRYCGQDSPAVTHFPYAVVEIKLQCAENERIAPWIEELMNCRYMESVPKYSKFAHGISSIYGHTPHIKYVPYWLHQLHIDIRAAMKPENSEWDPTMGIAAGCIERTEDRIVFGSRRAQTSTIGASEAVFLPAKTYTKTLQQMFQCVGVKAKLPPSDLSVDRRHDAFKLHKLYPFADGGTRALCFHDSRREAQTFSGEIPWQTGKRIKVPQKYDPKTLLTAERYMVKWVEKSAQLGLAGLAVIHFGYSHELPRANSGLISRIWQSSFHILIGLTLVVVSMLTSAYAFMVFRARSRRVYARRKIPYDDVIGPSTLTIIMIGGILLTALNRILLRFGPMLTRSDDF
jgi:uncharacterized membrane protein YidH (DUF202 family)